MALNDRQKRFCDEYLIDLNGTQAAIRAGYSAKTAAAIGAENLIKPNIQSYLKQRLNDREQRTEITQDMVIKELRDVAFAEAADYTDAKLKYSNKLKALELLGKHMGMFVDRVKMQTDVNIADSAERLSNIFEQMKEEK